MATRYDGALEFHHLDPNQKDVTTSHANHKVFRQDKKRAGQMYFTVSIGYREHKIKEIAYEQVSGS